MAIEVASPAEEEATDALARASVEETDPPALVRMLLHHVPELLGADETLDPLRAVERLTAWAASLQARLLAHVHQNCERPTDNAHHWVGRIDNFPGELVLDFLTKPATRCRHTADLILSKNFSLRGPTVQDP